MEDNVTTTATSGDHGGNRGHAKRTVFTRTQLTEMEQRFREQSFLSREERRELADQLRLTERQIMIWFQNRRGRLKRRGPSDRAYNPLKLTELTHRRPYPFLYGVLSSSAELQTQHRGLIDDLSAGKLGRRRPGEAPNEAPIVSREVCPNVSVVPLEGNASADGFPFGGWAAGVRGGVSAHNAGPSTDAVVDSRTLTLPASSGDDVNPACMLADQSTSTTHQAPARSGQQTACCVTSDNDSARAAMHTDYEPTWFARNDDYYPDSFGIVNSIEWAVSAL